MLLVPDREHQDAFTDAEIADQISTFFFAGVETTANLLASALNFIAGSEQLQEALRDEARRITHDGRIDLVRLPELTKTSQLLTETLRLYPPVWMTPRITTTTADTSLGGHHIPVGTRVIVSAYQLHRVERQYPNPGRFLPERWALDKPPRDAFFPYGGGARKCIGDEFGQMQATVTLSAVLTRWHLQAVDRPPLGRDCRDAGRPLGLRLRLTQPPGDGQARRAASATVRGGDTAVEGQPDLRPPGAVHATRRGVYRGDDLSQPGAAQRVRRRRPVFVKPAGRQIVPGEGLRGRREAARPGRGGRRPARVGLRRGHVPRCANRVAPPERVKKVRSTGNRSGVTDTRRV